MTLSDYFIVSNAKTMTSPRNIHKVVYTLLDTGEGNKALYLDFPGVVYNNETQQDDRGQAYKAF